MIIQEIINPKMLLDLGFTRVDETDEQWNHVELLVRNMRLIDSDRGCYTFIISGTIQGIGTMKTMDELIDGFEFVTSGEKLIKQ